MDSRKITGLSMIIAPVIAILGWIGMGLIVLDGASPGDPAKWMSELGANSEVVKFVMPLITVLFLIAIGGLNRIKNSMEGGEGHMMAGFGFLLCRHRLGLLFAELFHCRRAKLCLGAKRDLPPLPKTPGLVSLSETPVVSLRSFGDPRTALTGYLNLARPGEFASEPHVSVADSRSDSEPYYP